MVPARRALPTLEAPPVSSGRPALEATRVRVGHGGGQVQMELGLDAAEVPCLADSQLDQPRQLVLHHHSALPVPGEGLTCCRARACCNSASCGCSCTVRPVRGDRP